MYVLFARLLAATRRRHVIALFSLLAACVVAGAGLFAITEHIPFTSGLYWAITTATTVGYGDVTPHNASGRFVASLVMLTCIPLLGASFALLTGFAAASTLRKVLDMKAFPTGSYRLVVGMRPAVPAIVEELQKAHDDVVLVADVDPASVSDSVHLVRGDPTNPATLAKARPAGAEHCLLVGKSDGDVLVSAVLVRSLAPALPLSALVSSPAVRDALAEIGVEQIVSLDDLIAHTLAKSLETPHAGDLLLELISSEKHKLVEVEPDADSIGKALSGVRSDRDVLVLGLVRGKTVTLGVGDDPTVAAGDRLLLAVPRTR